jgi:hypothetical protein
MLAEAPSHQILNEEELPDHGQYQNQTDHRQLRVDPCKGLAFASKVQCR